MIPPSFYSDYLQLDRILNAQDLLSAKNGQEEHDEMLFIIMHQTYELWFKVILKDLDSILSIFQHPKPQDFDLMLTRLQRIQKIIELLLKQFEVIETMTPLKFLNFRGYLGTMSGFQSYQFRLIEVKLGLKREERLLYNKCPFDSNLKTEHQKEIQEAEKQPTLFSYVEKWLERIPFLETSTFDFKKAYREAFEKMMNDATNRLAHHSYQMDTKDVSSEVNDIAHHFSYLFDENKYQELLKTADRHFSYKSFLSALFLRLYRQEPSLLLPDQLLSAIYEVNSLLTLWRYRHSVMVQKEIGWKRGTGGSSGVGYLRATVEKHNVFSDLYFIPMLLLPEEFVPKLPKDLIPSIDPFFTQNIS